ncbi:uncharacterized protein [Centruroides vittatus]|uniref:uncharacterized protein n=3 Tax=Centruroides vittatus TaxID=120091 RepID=UPI00350FA60D
MQITAVFLEHQLKLGNIIVDAPEIPRLFAFAKTHKKAQQLRPVVDKTKAPTRILESFTHNLLIPHLEGYQFNITNPAELIEKLKKIAKPAYATVLDFRSLFPSIELPPCFCELRDFLFSIVEDNTMHQHILELAHLLCYGSLFQFKGITYMQGKGVPMGSPLSGDLCEMVIRRLENNILPRFLPSILLYKRYIDDIIIFWKVEPDIKLFLEAINSNPYGLTLEVEQHDSSRVHFLDIDINFEGANILTSVYRKPSTFHTYIPRNSYDPFQYKIAAFRALVRRAHTHSSTKKALETELNHIQNIAISHGYSKTLIEKLSRRHENSQKENKQTAQPLNITQEENERIPITYNPVLKSIYKTVANRQGINIVYRRCQTLFRILSNGKDPPNPDRLPGVYMIPLEDHRCDRQLTYIGSTKRALKVRLKEHESDIHHGRYTTALATYASEEEITADLHAAKIIIPSYNPQQLKWLEAIEIFKAGLRNTCVNHKDEMILSSAWQVVLENSV